MAGLGWLRAGTITVGNGSRNVGGTDTMWSGGVVNPGDIILLPNGTLGEVESVGSNTALTLKQAYTGATASAQPYAIIRMLPSGNVAADLAAGVQALIQRAGATFDQLFELLDSYGVVSFSDGTTTLSGLHGLRKLMADIDSKAGAQNPTFAGSASIMLPGGATSAPALLFKGGATGRLMQLYDLSLSPTAHMGCGVNMSGNQNEHSIYYPALSGGSLRIGSYDGAVFSEHLAVTDGALRAAGPVRPGQYTLSTLPAASAYAGHLATVSNAAGGPALCLSNGSSWINIRTNAPVN